MSRLRCQAGLLAAALGLALASCAQPVDHQLDGFSHPVGAAKGGVPPAPSTPITWRTDPTCRSTSALPATKDGAPATRQDLAATCQQNGRDFVSVSISGGGTKAALFGAESMFYLDAIGPLRRTALLSSVSGGSFAAAYYALSCDPNDKPCTAELPHGNLLRPLWDYQQTMDIMARGFTPMLWRAARNFIIPGVETPVPTDIFARYIDRTYFHKAGEGAEPFLFSDLNPRRPALALNSTLLSGTRPLAEGTRNLNYLRRRNADEMLHFAFTDYYFGHIGSDLRRVPLAYGVAASGAFPALIGFGTLRNFRYCTATDSEPEYAACLERPETALTLTDGGANDNQGLVELLATLGELVVGESRSDHAGHPCLFRNNINCLQMFEDGDKALLFVLNSSITESTGADAPSSGIHPFGFILGTVDRISDAVDVYSAVGYNLRRRLYASDTKEAVSQEGRSHRDIKLTPVEISLLMLDRYAAQGADVARLREAGVLPALPCPGPAANPEHVGHDLDCATVLQPAAWAAVRDNRNRAALGLGHVHPQCLFEQSKPMESGIASLAKIDAAYVPCLREAARWATALRAEELCEQNETVNDSTALHCRNNHLAPLDPTWQQKFASANACDLRAVANASGRDATISMSLALVENPYFVNERRELRGKPLPQLRSLVRDGTLDMATLCDMDDRNYDPAPGP